MDAAADGDDRSCAVFELVAEVQASAAIATVASTSPLTSVVHRHRESGSGITLAVGWPSLPTLFDFQPEDARAASRVRAALEACGKSIGAYDLLIAGQALRLSARLATSNYSGFAPVTALTRDRALTWT